MKKFLVIALVCGLFSAASYAQTDSKKVAPAKATTTQPAAKAETTDAFEKECKDHAKTGKKDAACCKDKAASGKSSSCCTKSKTEAKADSKDTKTDKQ